MKTLLKELVDKLQVSVNDWYLGKEKDMFQMVASAAVQTEKDVAKLEDRVGVLEAELSSLRSQLLP